MRKFFVTLILSAVTLTASAQLTYKDVAGIFFARCTSCHHEGGAGPFPFMTYSQTLLYNVDITDALNARGVRPATGGIWHRSAAICSRERNPAKIEPS